MAFIDKMTAAIKASEANDLDPIFEIDENSQSPEPLKKPVQNHSASIRRKKEPSQFIHVDASHSGRKIVSRPMRKSDPSPSNSPPKEIFSHKGSSASDFSDAPTKAGSPPVTPPIGQRTLSRHSLKHTKHLNRGNSVLEKLSNKIKDNRNHHSRHKGLFHHRFQTQQALSFSSPEAIKNFINGLSNSDKYRPIELDLTGSEIRASQLQVMLNHIALKKCTSLVLNGCSHLNTESFGFLTAETRKLQNLDLSNLIFNHRDINRSIANLILAHRKTLQSLNFTNSENLDHSVLQAIMQCSELQFLNISNVNFHYDQMISRFFDSILDCSDQHLLHLLNQSLKTCLKLVRRLESLNLSKSDWSHLLTFKNLGTATTTLSRSDKDWQTLAEFRHNPDIREAVNLPNENWQNLLEVKQIIQTEMDLLNLPQWQWRGIYNLWSLNDPEDVIQKYNLEELIRITSANEKLAKLNLTPLQANLLSLPEDSWAKLTNLYTQADMKAALRLNDTDWEILLEFRSFPASEWRSLSLSQLKLASLNLSPTDVSILSFLNQHLSFLPFTERDYSHFFNTEKFSRATLQAFMLTDDKLKKCVASDAAIRRLHSLHQIHSYDDTVPDIFIQISESLLSIYPTEPIDQNITSMQMVLAFKNALETYIPSFKPNNKTDEKDTKPKTRAFKKDLSALRKVYKYTENPAFFEFLKTRMNFLPTLFVSCPQLQFLDVSSFLLPFHSEDINKIENSQLLAIALNDLGWVGEDVVLFQSLFKHFPQLESLSFMNTGNSSDLPFYKSSLPNLKHLNISHQSRITVDTLKQDDQHFQKLEELNLSFCPLLLDFPLVVFLLRNARNLKTLEVDIATLSFKNLRFLLDGIQLDPAIQGLGKQLTSLTVSNHHIQPKRLQDIIDFCPNLEVLNGIAFLETLNT